MINDTSSNRYRTIVSQKKAPDCPSAGRKQTEKKKGKASAISIETKTKVGGPRRPVPGRFLSAKADVMITWAV